MKKLTILLLLLAFTLTSCVSMAPPKNPPEEGKGLVIGRVIYNGSGIKDRNVDMNGKVLRGIELTIVHDSGSFTVETGNEGIFYFIANTGEYYRIKKISVKRTNHSTGDWSSSWKRVRYTIRANSKEVTNIGTFYWNASELYSIITKIGKHDEIETIFEELFPGNAWTEEAWVNSYVNY